MPVIDLGDSRSVNMLIISGWKCLNHCSSQGIDLDYARYMFIIFILVYNNFIRNCLKVICAFLTVHGVS